MPPILPLSLQVDMIGTLYADRAFPPGWTLGDPLPVPAALAGWHVNVTPEVVEAHPELDPFVVTPVTLRRVWAGDDPSNPSRTIALVFVDEPEADDCLSDLT
jgi:hypothetical protein